MSKTTYKPLSPFFAPLFSLTVGIATQSYFEIHPTILTIVAMVSGLFLVLGQKIHTLKALYLLVFCAGGLTFFLCHHKRSILKNNLPPVMTIVATVTDCEKIVEKRTTRLTLAVEQIIGNNNHHTNITFSLHYYLKHCLFQIGDELSVSNVSIKKDSSPDKKSPFENYLAKENILAAFYHTKKNEITLLNRPTFSWRRLIWDKREKIYQTLTTKTSSSCKSLLGLVFFGNKQQKNLASMRHEFNAWGISHYLARSGLHIVFLIGIWSFFLFFLPINIQLKRFFLLIMCLLYACLSWSNIPFIRALAVFGITQFGKITSQRTNTLHILSIVCLLILLFNPLQLFSLDFQLTFGLTFALVLLGNM